MVRRAANGMGLLLVFALVVALGHDAAAERANRSPAALRAGASEIVAAVVESVETDRTASGDWEHISYRHTLRVERVDRGDVALTGTSIDVKAAQRAWIGRGLPPPSGSGHRGLPQVGERVLVHLSGDESGFTALEPNGYVAAPAPTSIEVEFAGDSGLMLSGTLVVPASATAETPVAGALLLPGSGPTDRNGNQLPGVKTELHRTLAESLADHGVATLRFDKRATKRYAAQWPTEPAELGEYFALDRFVGDARAALEALREDERVDASRTVVIGHSEGGLITLLLGGDAPASPAMALRGVGLLSTAGRTLDVVIHEQLERSLDTASVIPEFRAAIMQSLDETIASIREGNGLPEQVHPMLRSIFNPTTVRILHGYITSQPTALAHVAPGSALVLIGDADVQVSFERDTPPLVAALKGRDPGRSGDVVEVVLPGVGHNLKPVAQSDAFNFSGPVAPSALFEIIEWVAGSTGR